MVHALAPVPHYTQAPVDDNPNPILHVKAVTLLVHEAALDPQVLQVLLRKY